MLPYTTGHKDPALETEAMVANRAYLAGMRRAVAIACKAPDVFRISDIESEIAAIEKELADADRT